MYLYQSVIVVNGVYWYVCGVFFSSIGYPTFCRFIIQCRFNSLRIIIYIVLRHTLTMYMACYSKYYVHVNIMFHVHKIKLMDTFSVMIFLDF